MFLLLPCVLDAYSDPEGPHLALGDGDLLQPNGMPGQEGGGGAVDMHGEEDDEDNQEDEDDDEDDDEGGGGGGALAGGAPGLVSDSAERRTLCTRTVAHGCNALKGWGMSAVAIVVVELTRVQRLATAACVWLGSTPWPSCTLSAPREGCWHAQGCGPPWDTLCITSACCL